MGGNDVPFIYPPSSRRVAYPYSDFNPKSVTQAAYKSLQEKPKPKRDGPLINFNQHPDSYMIVGQQNITHKPMSPNTKKKVTILRWFQFALRLIGEIGALGMLVCVVCLKGLVGSWIWICRIAPAWDIIISLYAIYHLVRSSKARTPASSASYHLFAFFMDAGLIPFYVLIALLANTNYIEAPDNKERWTSVFTTPGSTTLLLKVTFLGSAAIGGLHVLCIFFDLWLVILFRKIAKLPPDMNPLEDNLTSGGPRASKHKHKNSELTLTDPVSEKKLAYLSGSTLSVDQNSRLSTATKEYGDKETRAVPFSHSRMQSASTYSPHNPETARLSRQHFEDVNMYSHSPRGSRSDVYSSDVPVSLTPGKHTSFVSRPGSNSSPRSFPYDVDRTRTDVTDFARFSSPALPNAAPSQALVRSQQQDGLLHDNWTVVEDDASDQGTPSRKPLPIIRKPVGGSPRIDQKPSFEHEPLRMNPPTPPPKDGDYPDPDDYEQSTSATKRTALGERHDNGNGNLNRQLTVKSDNTNTSSVYSESAPPLKPNKTSSPKRKYYGDLAAATLGIRGTTPEPRNPSTGTVNAAAMDSTGMCALGDYGYSPTAPPGAYEEKSSRKKDNKGRVVSRTGVDITDAQTLYPPQNGYGIRGRQVSGKVAEEGRAGGWWHTRKLY